MSLLASPNPFKEPIDIGPEPTKDPSPQRAKVLDFAKVVHLSCLVERVRRAADEAALYAQSKVYAPDMVNDFAHTTEVLQFITTSLGELGSAFKLIISETAADLSGSVVLPAAGASGGIGGAKPAPPSVMSDDDFERRNP